MPPCLTLNVAVPWDRLFGVLGAPPKSAVLPVIVPCPRCAGAMEVRQDYTSGGQWASCRKCRFAGDMIQLASTVWRLNIPATLKKLAATGFEISSEPRTIEDYRHVHLGLQKRLAALWQKAQPYVIHHSTTLRGLLSELGLEVGFSPDRWLKGPGKILGGCSALDASMTIQPKSILYDQALPRPSGTCRVFKGGKWQDVAMIPFYDLPQRICAVGFIGRAGDMSRDYVFHPLPIYTNLQDKTQRAEAGLAFHPDLFEHATDWDHTVVAVSDILLYLKLQFRQFEHLNQPLPLACWQHRPGDRLAATRNGWDLLKGRKVVLWDPGMSPDTLQQAIDRDFHLCNIGPTKLRKDTMDQYLWRSTPVALCHKIQKLARPWPIALARMAEDWTDSQLEERLVQLQIKSHDLKRLLKQCTPDTRDRVRAMIQVDRNYRSIPMDGVNVLEQPDGWFCGQIHRFRNTYELISDAKLVIHQVVHYAMRDQTLYKGVVLYHGEEIPFCELQDDVEKHTGKWLRKLLISKGKGLLKHNPRWSPKLVTIATHFHQPDFIRGVDRVGWDADQMAFILPRGQIGVDGIKPCEHALTHRDIPAASLALPDSCPIAFCDESPTGSLCVAAAASVLAIPVAPALLRDPKGLALVGTGARTVGLAVADAVGCLQRSLKRPSDVRTLLDLEQQHLWPLAVDIPPATLPYTQSQWLHADLGPRRCVAPMGPLAAAVHKLEARWNIVTSWDPVDDSVVRRLVPLLKKITGCYLHDLCRRRLQAGHFLDDFLDFITRNGGRIDEPTIRDLVWSSEVGDVSGFADLLGVLVMEGSLRLVLEGFEGRDRNLMVRLNKRKRSDLGASGGLLVTYPTLFELLAKRALRLPDRSVITNMLRAAKVLKSVTEDGWVIDDDWWTHHHRQAVVSQERLRIVG